jgi:opacity protein-like surface antigen
LHHTLRILAFAASVVVSALAGRELPTGTLLELRLRNEVSSFSSRPNDPVLAVLIAPVRLEGEVRIPAGAIVTGRVESVRRIGLGLVHETAALRMAFDQLELPSGERLTFSSQLISLENAREKVDSRGAIQGIRATATPGHKASGVLTSLAAFDPISLMFSTAAFTTVLSFTEPEIRLPAGAELMLKLTAPLEAPPVHPEPTTHLTLTAAARTALAGLVRQLPYRTETAVRHEGSDLTNVMLIGEPEAIVRAFTAAGWLEPMPLDGAGRYRTLRAVVQTRFYPEAPMSLLLLNGQAPVWTFSKTLNTFGRRHHLRIYDTGVTWLGQPVFTAAATQDIAITMAVGRQPFNHRIDERIDNERSKVVNDLVFTGCVSDAETMERPWVPEGLTNGTGQKLVTDRALSMLRLNECREARGFLDSASEDARPHTGNRSYRGARQAVLTARNDLIRGNFVFQGVSLALQARRFFANRASGPTLPPDRGDTLPPNLPVNTAFPMVASAEHFVQPRERRGPVFGSKLPGRRPSVELDFHAGGLMFFRSTSGAEGILYKRADQEFAFTSGNRISPGYSFGLGVTMHANERISHEFGLNFQRGKFDLDLMRLTSMGEDEVPGLVEQETGLLTRQFSYGTAFHFLGPNSRVRPYVVGGPAFQLVQLTDAPFQKARGIFRLGLSNVGMIRAAYNFGSANPLEGGGIFQMAGQVGAGVKIRLNPHWLMRLEYRDSISRRPDFLAKSIASAAADMDPALAARVEPLPSVPSRGRFIQQRVTMGLSFTF